MTNEHTQQPPRLLTTEELALLVKFFRDMRQWSQEQLAEISRLSVRTIQRIERGAPSDLDSRRALATAFEFEDIDVFNKPFCIPTEEDLKAQKEQFDREHITLEAVPLATGRQLAGLVEAASMDLATPGCELPRAADEVFAELIDYFRDYRDCASDYPESAKFQVYDEMQSRIDALVAMGFSLRCATRKVSIKATPDATPWPTTVLYVVAFPVGREPDKLAVQRSANIRW